MGPSCTMLQGPARQWSQGDKAGWRRGEPERSRVNAEPSPAATCTNQNPRPAQRDGAPAGPAATPSSPAGRRQGERNPHAPAPTHREVARRGASAPDESGARVTGRGPETVREPYHHPGRSHARPHTARAMAERKRIACHRRPRCPPVPHRAGSSPFPRTPRSQDHTARRPSTGGPRACTPQPGGAHNGRAAQCTTKGRSPSARTSRMQSADNQPIQRDPAPT